MIIPGFLIAILTFPGVIVHELAHQFFCRLMGVPVFKVCYFRIGNPAGYVIHEPPPSAWASLLIGLGPFLINTIVGVLIAFPAVLTVFKLSSGDVLDGFLIWLGVSIAMHAFPSTGDAQSMWKAVTGPKSSIFAKIVAVPLVGLIWIGAIGSVFWLDAIYGIFVVAALPNLLVLSLA